MDNSETFKDAVPWDDDNVAGGSLVPAFEYSGHWPFYGTGVISHSRVPDNQNVVARPLAALSRTMHYKRDHTKKYWRYAFYDPSNSLRWGTAGTGSNRPPYVDNTYMVFTRYHTASIPDEATDEATDEEPDLATNELDQGVESTNEQDSFFRYVVRRGAQALGLRPQSAQEPIQSPQEPTQPSQDPIQRQSQRARTLTERGRDYQASRANAALRRTRRAAPRPTAQAAQQAPMRTHPMQTRSQRAAAQASAQAAQRVPIRTHPMQTRSQRAPR